MPVSRKAADLARRKRLLVAEGALLRAEATLEAREVKKGWDVVARGLSAARALLGGPARRLIWRR